MIKQVLKRELLKLVERVDSDSCNMCDDELREVCEAVQRLTDDWVVKEVACEKILHVSRATFDNYVRAGYIPRGRKLPHEPLKWSKKELYDIKKKLFSRCAAQENSK